MSRESILASVRAHKPASIDLPSAPTFGIRYEDISTQFKQAVESVGGICTEINAVEEIKPLIDQHYADAKTIFHTIGDELPIPSLSAREFSTPHDGDKLDLLITRGTLGVAENGAIWVEEKQLPQRSLFFLTQHLVLVVKASTLLHNLHEAYASLGLDHTAQPWAGFIAGPSKTADVEQCLVIGAHGSRSLLVLLET